jgi:hypothetical protein
MFWVTGFTFPPSLLNLPYFLQSRSFGFAGTKDKRAVTTQQVCIPQVYDRIVAHCTSLIRPKKPWSGILAKIWHRNLEGNISFVSVVPQADYGVTNCNLLPDSEGCFSGR